MNGLSTQQLTLGTSILTTSGNALLVNGVLVSGANISTGQLTGTFYPLYTNPSGYITTGQTGSFGGGSTPTGNLTGVFYPLLNNPSGFILPSQTGIFTVGSNIVYTTGTQFIGGTKVFTDVMSVSGGAGENAYFTQKTNTEFVWGLNVNSLNSDSLDNPLDSAFKLGMMTTNVSNGGGGYNGLHLQTMNAGVGSWGSSSTVWILDVTGNMTVTGNLNTKTIIMSGQPISNYFYPLSSNPSNYITQSQTGVFINTGQTGAFASIINLGITGNTLQLELNNLNGWTGNSTGIYYPYYSNPSGYLTGFNSGLYTLNSNTGSFITTNQTGSYSSAFYPRNSNPSGYITTGQTGAFGGGSTNTGILTGVFYPLLNNPSGFILPSQTGAFASAINLGITGNTLQLEINSLNSWTGGSTGLYYPLNSNPSGYVTAGQVSGTYFPSVNYSTVINWSSGNSFYTTLTGNTIFSFTGSQDGQSIAVFVKNTGTNGFTGAWPSTLRWPGQVLPVQTSGNFVDIYTLVNLTGVIFGSYIQGF